jgi:Fe(3+) dicitrate transport protein
VGVGGELRKDLLYYNFLQYKRSQGWRPNEQLESLAGFNAVDWRPSERWYVALEFSHLHYLAQQPGGLTDAQFARDPSVSLRARNWFRVSWLLPALRVEYRPDDRQQWELRTFGLVASREALGNLERIHVMDLPGNRHLIADQYRNLGAELRYLNRFDLVQRYPAAFLAGLRAYRGRTHQQQGEADAGSGPTFRFIEGNRPNLADYRNPGDNVSLFAETVIHLSERWKLAPGVRYEGIRTRSDGFYQFTLRDLAGQVVAVDRTTEAHDRFRSIGLAGLGVAHRARRGPEVFANFTLNYRPITFSDLRIQNPNFVIDPNLQDERGWNADLGTRGAVGRWLRYDASVFLLAYANRIGEVLRADQAPLFLPYRYRTNIGRSLAQGLESYVEIEPTAWGRPRTWRLLAFANAGWTHARYVQSDQPGVEGKQVEYAPDWVVRSGLTLHWRGLRVGVQHHYTSEQFADATNAPFSSNASIGRVPA